MMIARPTAASAAATVMTKKTKTCPATPYTCANATKVRFTALSISSTHMKMMIALRRVSTPTTPIVNSTAEKKRASASMERLQRAGFVTRPGGSAVLPADDDRADDRGEEQDARHLEREQVLREQRTRQRPDGALARGDVR